MFMTLLPSLAAAHIEKGPMPDAVAEMEYRILLEFQPEKTDVRNNLGMVLYRRNKLDKAEKEFLTVLEYDPDNFNAIDSLGLVYFKKGEVERALAQHRKAAAINPDDVLVYFHIGNIHAAANQPEMARRQYEKALENAEKIVRAGGKAPDMEPVKKALAALPAAPSSAAGGTGRP